ncbi:MAG: hypothetical protein VB036_16355 [Propionicimonas sp.]|nr:hypothetical protein [Propionicimonas sp.]
MTRPTTPIARWRAPVAAVLVVLGLLLAPVAVGSQYARTILTDTGSFVAAFAPLADDPGVQDAVTRGVVEAVATRVDLAAVADSLIDDLVSQGASRPTTAALRLLKLTALQALRGVVTSAVDQVVTSSSFADVWRASLRASHATLNATLRGDPAAVVSLNDDAVALELGPVLQQGRSRLVGQGVPFAHLIPADAQVFVPLAEVQGLGRLPALYRAVDILGVWLPVASAVLLVAGIAVAGQRLRWLVWTGAALAVLMALLGAVLAVGRSALQATGVAGGEALDAFYGAAVRQMVVPVTWIGVLALLVAVGAWLAGRGRGTPDEIM